VATLPDSDCQDNYIFEQNIGQSLSSSLLALSKARFASFCVLACLVIHDLTLKVLSLSHVLHYVLMNYQHCCLSNWLFMIT
jgi:hypothetical protein